MTKTSWQMDDTIICDTLSVLDYNKSLTGGGQREDTSADYSFALHDLIVGNKCDIIVRTERERERERERETVLPITHSSCSGMNTIYIDGHKLSVNLKSINAEYSNESLPANYRIIGVTEANGCGMSGGTWIRNTFTHAYVNGVKKFTRLFIRME